MPCNTRVLAEFMANVRTILLVGAFKLYRRIFVTGSNKPMFGSLCHTEQEQQRLYGVYWEVLQEKRASSSNFNLTASDKLVQ